MQEKYTKMQEKYTKMLDFTQTRLYNENTNARKIHKGDFMMEKDSDITKDLVTLAFSQLTTNKARAAVKARTEQELSKYALRIIALITILLKDNQNQGQLKFSMKYVEGFMGSRGKNVRNGILKALEELKNANFKAMQGPYITSTYMYLRDYTYDPRIQEINLQFDKASLALVYNLDGGFAKIVWLYTFGMKSKYGQKIYELIVLEKFRRDKMFTISLDEFKGILGVQNKYPNSNNLKKYVIEPGIRDVNECTPFNLTYEVNKNLIRFSIIEKSKEEIAQITEKLKESKSIKDILESYEHLKEESLNEVSEEEFNRIKLNLLKNANKIVGTVPTAQKTIAISQNESLEIEESTEEA